MARNSVLNNSAVTAIEPAYLVDGNGNLTSTGEEAIMTFHLLSGKIRLSVLDLLSRVPEMNVKTLTEELGKLQPAVSGQLALLKEGGLVRSRRDGKEVFYSAPSAEESILPKIADSLERTVGMRNTVPQNANELSTLFDRSHHVLRPTGNSILKMAKILSCDIRLQILGLLRDGRRHTTEFLEFIDRVQPDITHHIHLMEKQRFVSCTEEGRFHYYSLINPVTSPLPGFFQQLRRLAKQDVTSSPSS